MNVKWHQLFETLSKQQVAVIGDVMLDSYLWGSVDRISPEAPVPVVAVDHKEERIGGAGNVALNTVALGAPTTVFSVIGNDKDGQTLLSLFNQNNIDSSYIISSNDRVTTSKTRIISRSQQMMRLDSEMVSDINEEEEQELLMVFKSYVNKVQPAVVILEDYNKGVLTERTIADIIEICNQNNIITTVDPKRKNFFNYKGVTLFKPNLKEVKDALNVLLDDVNVEFLQQVHAQLRGQLHHNISLITLSEKGVFYQDKTKSEILPGYFRSITDVSGAGDTVIAVASLAYAATKDIQLAASMANLAGGLVCEEVGTAAINKEKLFKECIEALT